MEYVKIVIGGAAWIALCLIACTSLVGIIALCGKEDNGGYTEPNEGK